MASVRGLVGMGRVMRSGRRLCFVFKSSHKDKGVWACVRKFSFGGGFQTHLFVVNLQ